MDGEQISALMAIKDDPVRCVLLKADGSAEEPVVDMTPSKGEVRELLGGQVTISGLYEQVGAADLNVVIVTLASAAGDVPENPHVLPQPFADAKHRGSILLFRNDEDAKPVDFTLADYEALKKAKASEEQPASAGAAAEEEEEEEDDDDEDDDEDDEDDEDEGLTEEQQAMLEAVIGNFTQMKGRPPTELELVAIMNQLNAKIADVGSDEDSDVNEGDLSGEDDEDDDSEEEDEEEGQESEEEAEEEMPAAPASISSAARLSRKPHRASVEGTPAVRGSRAKAPLPPAPIIRKKRAGATS